MGSLGQESRNLPLLCGCIACSSKGAKRLCGRHKGIVGVEVLGRTSTVVAMQQQLVKQVSGNETANVATARAGGGAAALALAPGAAVVAPVAAPPEFAAA